MLPIASREKQRKRPDSPCSMRGLSPFESFPQTASKFLKSLEGLRIPDIQENQKLLAKTDSSLLKGARQLSKMMMKNKLLHAAVDPASLLDDRLVKNVK